MRHQHKKDGIAAEFEAKRKVYDANRKAEKAQNEKESEEEE